jgi:hypothetical protein
MQFPASKTSFPVGILHENKLKSEDIGGWKFSA